MKRIECIIMDWAGTAVDYGCFAPVAAFVESFRAIGKTLVAYFSATGTTARAAKLVEETVDGTLYEIQPAKKYTAADLDWHDKASRSSVEMSDSKSRPALYSKLGSLAEYDTIYIGSYLVEFGSKNRQYIYRKR